MKLINQYYPWTAYLVTFVLFFVGGCIGDDNGDNGDAVVPSQAIAGTWFVRDSADVTVPENARGLLDLRDFRLTITPSLTRVDYTTDGSSPAVFPPQGTLVVNGEADFEAGTEVLRQPDLVLMDMILLEDTTLRIAFTIGTDSSVPADNSRISQIGGEYTFMLTKQE